MKNTWKKSARSLRLEQLENRELLSATTWSNAIDADAAVAAEMSAAIEETKAIDLTTLVTTTDDVVDATDSVNSLREAIAAAKAGATITFDASLDGGVIKLDNGELMLAKDVTIDASALDNGITIDAQGQSRVFATSTTAYVDATFINLTITNGYVDGDGAGIYANSLKTLSTLTLIDCTLTNNRATGSGGGFYAGQGYDVVIENTTITGNTADGGGSQTGGKTGGGGFFAAYNSDVTVKDSVVSDNTSGNQGGGFLAHYIDVKSSTISENGAKIGGGGYVWASSGATVEDSVIADNVATESGAGFRSYYTKFDNVIVTGNTAPISGGIADNGAGSKFYDSIILGNTTPEGEASDLGTDSSEPESVGYAYNTISTHGGWKEGSESTTLYVAPEGVTDYSDVIVKDANGNYAAVVPTGVKATYVDGTYNTITFEFGAVDGADKYVYQVSTDSTFADAEDKETTETSVNVDGLKANATYYFRVKTADSAWSAPAKAAIPAIQLATPGVDFTSDKPQSYVATITPVDNAVGYYYNLATNESNPTVTASGTMYISAEALAAQNYQISRSGSAGTKYGFRVMAVADPTSEYSDSAYSDYDWVASPKFTQNAPVISAISSDAAASITVTLAEKVQGPSYTITYFNSTTKATNSVSVKTADYPTGYRLDGGFLEANVEYLVWVTADSSSSYEASASSGTASVTTLKYDLEGLTVTAKPVTSSQISVEISDLGEHATDYVLQYFKGDVDVNDETLAWQTFDGDLVVGEDNVNLVSGLDAKSTYTFRVMAYGDNTHNGTDFVKATAETFAIDAFAPTVSVKNYITDENKTSAEKSVNLTIDGAEGDHAVAYRYEYATKADFSDAKVGEVDKEGVVTINGLDANTTYYFRAMALAEVGSEYADSGWSEETADVTTDKIKLADPVLGPDLLNHNIWVYAAGWDNGQAYIYVDIQNNVANAAGYKVEYRQTTNAEGEDAGWKSTTITDDARIDVKAGASYEVKVTALGGENTDYADSDASKVVSVETKQYSLAAPSISATMKDSATITVTLGEVANAGDYTLQYRVNGGDWTTVEGVAAASTYDLAYDSNATYQFQVKAAGATYEYAASSYRVSNSVDLKLATPAISTGLVGSDYVTLTIDAVANAQGYEYEYSLNSDFSDSTIVSIKDAGTYKVSGLAPNKMYYFRAKATGTLVGEAKIDLYASEWTETINAATTKAQLAVPEFTLTGTSASSLQITVTTEYPEGVTYNVMYQEAGTPDSQWKVQQGLTINGLEAGKSYNVMVQAVGFGDYSNSLFSAAKASDTLKDVMGVMTVTVDAIDSSSATISFTRFEQATGYVVEVGTLQEKEDGSFEWKYVSADGAYTETGSYIVSGLDAYTEYSFRVTAKGTDAYNDAVGYATETTAKIQLVSPTVTVGTVGSNSVSLNIVVEEGDAVAPEYQIFVVGNGGVETITVKAEELADGAYEVTGLKANRDYVFAVWAIDGGDDAYIGATEASRTEGTTKTALYQLPAPGFTLKSNAVETLTVTIDATSGNELEAAADYYLVMYQEAGAIQWQTAMAQKSGDTAVLTLVNLDNTKEYNVTVVALGFGDNLSSPTALPQTTGLMKYPLTAPTLDVTEYDHDSITVNFTVDENTATYELQYATRADACEADWVALEGAKAGEDFVFDANELTTYYFRVKAAGKDFYDVATSDIASATTLETPSIVVTTSSDRVDSTDGEISLREAIAYAKAGDTITFTDGTDGTDGLGFVALKWGALDIDKAITIDGGGRVMINAQFNDRAVTVAEGIDGVVAFKGLTFTNGVADLGGAVLANSATSFENCVVVNNKADHGAGLVLLAPSTVTNTLIADNEATYGGGAVYAGYTTVEFANVTIANNKAGSGSAFQGVDMLIGKTSATFNNSILLGDVYDAALTGNNTLSTFNGWENADGTNFVYDAAKPLFAEGGYALAERSQALGLADGELVSTTTDLAGADRVQGLADLGAYESAYGKVLATPTLTIDTISDTKIEFTIGEVDNASGYVYQYVTEADYNESGFENATEATYNGEIVIDGWNAFTKYYVRVKAVGTGNYADSEYSLVADTQTLEAPSTTVTTGDDVVDSTDGLISLREALSYAKDGDTITFAEGVENVTLEKGQLVVGKAITIDGGEGVTIDAQKNSRIFSLVLENDTVALAGLTLVNGLTTDHGGAVFVAGQASFTDVVVKDSVAERCGGAVYVDSYASATFTNTTFDNNVALRGAGVYVISGGYAEFVDATITNNVAENGAAVYLAGQASFVRGEISGNEATSYGGGVYVLDTGKATFEDVVISDNTAHVYGGGVMLYGPADFVGGEISGNKADLYGGGVSMFKYAAATFDGVSISENSADLGGGVYVAKNAAATFSGEASVDANMATTGAGLYLLGNANVADTSISGNTATENGGGVYVSSTSTKSTFTNATIANNSAENGAGAYLAGKATFSGGKISGNAATTNGAGLYVLKGGKATLIDDVLVAENTASKFGAGLYLAGNAVVDVATFDGNTAKRGGGVYVESTGNADFTDATIANNKAENGAGLYVQKPTKAKFVGGEISGNYATNYGGGVYVIDGGNATFEGVTISENSADVYGAGVALYGSATLTNTAIVDNKAPKNSDHETQRGGGLYIATAGSATLVNATVADNKATNGAAVYIVGALNLSNSILLGSVVNRGVLNASNTLSSFEEWSNKEEAVNFVYDATLPLFGEGYALAENSQAIDKGDNAANASTTDLAGDARIVGDAVDLGAYEFQAPVSASELANEAFADAFDEFDFFIDEEDLEALAQRLV